ncbi:MAG: zinc ribbon domain-containing protein [Methanomassiliicoccales archaeon]|nr:MAG: zinc ribbon domain-containing protein [Methanomassiliicoccales archaeon]
MFCSKCGSEVSEEANYCEKCGTKLQSDTPPSEEDSEVVPQEIVVELVEKESPEKPCEMCGNAELESVNEEGKPSLYRCPSCGHYFGNFMKKGCNIYYDTTHLRIGQYIASQLIHGKYRISAHKNQREKGLEDLAGRIQQDIKLDRKKITKALSYLIEQNVLYTYYEPTPDGEFEWFGIAFSDSVPADTEMTK